MNQQDAITTLRKFDTAPVKQALSEGVTNEPEIVADAIDWITSIRDEMVTALEAIDGEEDFEMIFAINYIELKSRWIAINCEINYQFMKNGACDHQRQARGFATTMLLAEMEPLLSDADIDQITSFLAEPVRNAA